jgi:hypothetical protein
MMKNGTIQSQFTALAMALLFIRKTHERANKERFRDDLDARLEELGALLDQAIKRITRALAHPSIAKLIPNVTTDKIDGLRKLNPNAAPITTDWTALNEISHSAINLVMLSFPNDRDGRIEGYDELDVIVRRVDAIVAGSEPQDEGGTEIDDESALRSLRQTMKPSAHERTELIAALAETGT